MNQVYSPENQIAKRLLRKIEKKTFKGEKQMQKENRDLSTEMLLPTLPQDFIKAEKTLETLGFFTPSSRQTRKKAEEKVISFSTTIDGKRIKASASILPSAKYGLPDTADLDKYRAFQKILSDELLRHGKVPKHITFASSDLIEMMGDRKQSNRGGKLYKEIRDWLMRMVLTGISSEGAVYLAGKKVWARDTFHVFERAVAFGQEMEDGTIADCHHVWLSDWQLENINEFWLLSIDYDLHKQLRKPIAKSLLPLLQIGFYASGGTYTKRYDELCQFLGITEYKAKARIKQQLEPSFKELQGKGFLADWDYDKNELHKTYNIIWQAGERFYEAQDLLKQRGEKLTEPVKRKPKSITRPKKAPEPEVKEPEMKPEILEVKSDETRLSPLTQELIERGISESVARDFVESFDDEYLQEKIEMHDAKKATNEITTNSAGWLREAITRDFKISEEQKANLEAKAKQEEQKAQEEELRAKAKDIQEQRLQESIASFPEKDEWVEERVQKTIGVRKLMAESKFIQPLTDEEIEEKRKTFTEQYPETEEDRRKWLASDDENCRFEDIMSELKKKN